MSGGGLSNMRPGTLLDTAQLAGKKLMDLFKKSTLEDMRALSFEELTKMSKEYMDTTKKFFMWAPVIDNYLLKGTFTDVARANEIPDIPYMFGYTANDMGDATQAIKDFCALRAEKGTKPVYAYLFARPLPGDDNGAWHSSDLWYVFHSLRHSWRPFTKGDEALSLQMIDFYTNFAKFGNPNGKDNGLWAPYTTATPKFVVFDVDGDKAACTMTDSPEFKGPSPRK
jgi:para-nitrobenzyl esterase